MRSPRFVLLAAVALCSTWGCALFEKSAPITPRYFSPERPDDVLRPQASHPDAPAQVRLGRVSSSANLDEMLVFRDSSSEIGYYRLQRWTEAPEKYLRRRLARVLFEERGLHEVMGGGGPTLDVHLTAFEEIRVPRRLARVQVVVKLYDERLVSWEQTITVEEPVASGGDAADAAVEAIGKALRGTVDLIANRVVLELAVVEPAAQVNR